MGLYEVCAALANSLHVPVEENTESVSLIATDENTSLHITVPSFIRNDQRDRYQRSVFYISDLHLVHHIIEHFSEDVTDERIREYIHSIVLQLFDGEIGDAISKSRLYVHLSGDYETAFKVGARHGKPRIYQVASGQMAADGYVFYRSVNGVWLTKEVPPKYLTRTW